MGGERQPRQPRPTAATHEPTDAPTAATILAVVVELLESGGYDAVQLREVARRAHVSLTTVYKHFATRDDLVITALERWMATHSYAGLVPTATDETLRDGLMRTLRAVFEPWERSPRMLEAYSRAQTGPGGERLRRQGMNAIEPVARAVLEHADPDYAADLELLLTSMAYAVIGMFAEGDLDITAILPTLERAVFRLTTNNEPAARATQTAARRSRSRAASAGAPPRS